MLNCGDNTFLVPYARHEISSRGSGDFRLDFKIPRGWGGGGGENRLPDFIYFLFIYFLLFFLIIKKKKFLVAIITFLVNKKIGTLANALRLQRFLIPLKPLPHPPPARSLRSLETLNQFAPSLVLSSSLQNSNISCLIPA